MTSVVALLDDRPGKRGDHVAHTANLGDWRHLHRDVDDVHDGIAATLGARDVHVVVQAVLAVVVTLALALVLGILEVKVHHVSVFGRENLSRVRRLRVGTAR